MQLRSRASTNRPPAVAGSFYPADANRLQGQVRGFLDRGVCGSGDIPKAVIAPHAGFPYSGPIAGSAFLPWRGHGSRIRRVVLVGPSHYVDFRGVVCSSAAAFATPLGPVAVDQDCVEELARADLAQLDDGPHEQEHSLEVELPFLQMVLGEFKIVPLLVGMADASQVATVLERIWGGPETGIVISSDLSHYHGYVTAREMDAATARAIEALEPSPVDSNHACGWLPIQGLLRLARDCGAEPATIDLRNSGDTAGSQDRVVGYGAWGFVG